MSHPAVACAFIGLAIMAGLALFTFVAIAIRPEVNDRD